MDSAPLLTPIRERLKMRRRKKSRQGLVDVRELLEGALQQLGVKGDFEKFQLENKCRELLGATFSKGFVQAVLKGSTVQMEFTHSIWMNEFSFRKAVFLQELQRDLPTLGIKSLSLVLAGNHKKN